MIRKVYAPFVWFVALVLVVGAACNLGKATQATNEPVEKPTKEVETKPTKEPQEPVKPAKSGAANSLKEVQGAVIQIIAQGSFVDPTDGPVQGAWGGTGFFISPSGIAVTNNHVVTGASTLEVYVGGNTDKKYNARVLGVSECNDLAVIKVEGGPFPFLEWFEGDIDVGQDLYVAGFPLVEPEYSLVKGIVSKVKKDVATSWAAPGMEIVSDAATNPGNSGGPVITPDGKLLAVHYAGNKSTDQVFSIHRDVAVPVIEKLQNGENLDSIGVNGQAFVTDDQKFSGVFVQSIQPGSPADKAGVKGGDIISLLGDLNLGQDGTMADYCKIIRSHGSSDTVNIQVLRFGSEATDLLEGQLNGRELAVIDTYASGGGDSGGSGSSSGGAEGNPDASASGDAYIATEFDTVDNWYLLSVPEVDDDRYKAFPDNGVLYMEVYPEKVTVYAFYDMALNNPDVRVDTVAQKVAGANTNNLSVVCRKTDLGWYEFSMTSGGYWYIWLYYDGAYKLLTKGATTAIHMKNQENQLTAVCQGTEFIFYINGVEVGSVNDHMIKDGGQVGVSIYSEYPNLGVEFQWFAATVP